MKKSRPFGVCTLFFNACVSTIALLLTGGSVYASTIAVHTGANDPTTEGWTASTFQNTTAGPLSPDPVGGLGAWFVNDAGSSSGDKGFYFKPLTDSDITEAQTFGWSLFARLRLPNMSETGKGSPSISFNDGSNSYDMTFATDADGDPIVLLWDGGSSSGNRTGDSYTLEGAGSTYHTFELRFDPVAGSADLFIDGAEQLSDYSGYAFDQKDINFGAFSSGDTGLAHFNSVSFTTLTTPVPPAVWLFGSGLLVLIGMAKRKKAL